ncbi:metallopeptidase family protein [Garicola koreensis]|uniref:Putative Zn-dependent protease with MMP-like domain n=1 Tax=Garicola koreensis TaxID=1262554 RepID=A0A7W5Y1L0_9MICC|nr:metallopeptidase family protein [Garicola koreensis]MBB3668288.1 putative Zn-dependent protease with MMP-like domain [Garicola koreensis]
MAAQMSEEEFDAAVAEALEMIPAKLAAQIDNVAVFVEDRYQPQPGEDPQTTLLGLYEGIPLTERGGEPWSMPDHITLYMEPILDICQTREDVVHQVMITVVHEVAHFFGIDDATLHRLGWG